MYLWVMASAVLSPALVGCSWARSVAGNVISAHQKKYGELQTRLCWVWLCKAWSIHQPGGKGFVAYRSLGFPDVFVTVSRVSEMKMRGAALVSQFHWDMRKMGFRCPSLLPCSALCSVFTAVSPAGPSYPLLFSLGPHMAVITLYFCPFFVGLTSKAGVPGTRQTADEPGKV